MVDTAGALGVAGAAGRAESPRPALAALAVGAPPAPAPAPATAPPRPPRANDCGCGMAKPVGTTIDGVPVMLVTDVFSCGVRMTSCSRNRSHHCLHSFVRARWALT